MKLKILHYNNMIPHWPNITIHSVKECDDYYTFECTQPGSSLEYSVRIGRHSLLSGEIKCKSVYTNTIGNFLYPILTDDGTQVNVATAEDLQNRGQTSFLIQEAFEKMWNQYNP